MHFSNKSFCEFSIMSIVIIILLLFALDCFWSACARFSGSLHHDMVQSVRGLGCLHEHRHGR